MEASAMERLQSRCKKLKILYVEDDDVTSRYTQSILSEFFDSVVVARDGQNAYDLFFDAEIAIPNVGIPQDPQTQQFDLIITDIKMPKLDGISFITKIRQICKETAIIVTSAYNDVDYLIETIHLGVDGYILKPIELDQFLDSLKVVVEKVLLNAERRAYVSSLNQTIALQQSALEEQRSSLNNASYTKDFLMDTFDKDNVKPLFQPVCNAEGNIIHYDVVLKSEASCNHISSVSFSHCTQRSRYNMMETVFKMMALHPDKTFSIDMSFHDMRNQAICDLLCSRIRAFKETKQTINLIFDVHESENMTDFETIKNFLHTIQCEEARIAIVDFGMSTCNFSQLIALNPAYLKIAARLVENLDTDVESLKLVQGMIAFAHALHVKTIAEGVHTQVLFNLLVEMGVDAFEGYRIDEPSLELPC